MQERIPYIAGSTLKMDVYKTLPLDDMCVGFLFSPSKWHIMVEDKQA